MLVAGGANGKDSARPFPHREPCAPFIPEGLAITAESFSWKVKDAFSQPGRRKVRSQFGRIAGECLLTAEGIPVSDSTRRQRLLWEATSGRIFGWVALSRWLLVVSTGSGVLGLQHPCHATAAAGQERASSEIQQSANGYWLYLDGKRTPAFAGAVYQNTEGDRHVRDYKNSLHALYSPLDEEFVGGQGHGGRLARMGIQAIRVYELPVRNQEDANRTKEIFRRLYKQYRIQVLIGDWAGLHSGINFTNKQDLTQLRKHLEQLIATYAEEPWVLGWQLGNENNYHIRKGRLGEEINLDAAEYYSLMDGLIGLIKEQLGARHLTQFVSLGQGDLTEAEADLIASMKNVDAIGINCYRENADAFEQVISLAAYRLRKPIYFAEIGRPGDGELTEKQQSEYLQHVCSLAFSHSAGALGSGRVMGVFVHEATDEKWKRFERGNESDAHYGILGKRSEQELGRFLTRYHDFCTWILPATDAPDALIQAAWECLRGPYSRKYGRAYGHAMGYANRAITLYQNDARFQQERLKSGGAGAERAASEKFWALNTVGTGYFIIGNAWMLLSYDYEGVETASGLLPKFINMADLQQPRFLSPAAGTEVIATNAAGCIYYAQRVFETMRRDYPSAHLREASGRYRPLDRAVRTRFPELSAPYVPLARNSILAFSGSCLVLILGMALVSRWRAAKFSIPTEAVLSLSMKWLMVVVLGLNLACLYWFMNWWFHPVRVEYYTVRRALFILLTAIGAIGVLFYLVIWYVLWNMRRPVPMKATEGHRVAIVTTRVASEPIEALEGTLRKLADVTYPHDSFLLDEEDSDEAKARCQQCGVRHFSRKGNPMYNERTGNFQARTKGGNLNAWLHEYGDRYEFVTFLDPDHAPRPEFLDKVLGYFENPNVAFVQAPQVFHNRNSNWIARGAAEQSYFFYGPIQMGLFGIGACVVNGSHSTFRISDLFSLKGGGYAVHDADDILTSMRIHAIGKTGVYVPDVVAEGLAPDSWDEFSKQQRRWAYSMFHLLFHYYVPGLRGMPWRCRLVYLLLTSFYFRGVAFAGLLVLPFISAITGNPPVNANIVAFCCHYLPFLALNCGVLLLIGQRFLVPHGSERGFWYRAGILWVAMWWDHLCALVKATQGKQVRDRIVAAKWKWNRSSPWHAVWPHCLLAAAAIAAFAWTCLQPDRRQTVWGTLLFLGMIIVSQTFIVLKLTQTPVRPSPAPRPTREPQGIAITTVYAQQPRKS